jgi:hypothetical protein
MRKIFCGFIYIIVSVLSYSQGNLMIIPKRILFDNQRRTQDVYIANTGTEKATYVISFQEIRMTEEGEFQQITAPDSGQLFASPYLRVFPRSITLTPNETQTIKLQFNRAADMKAGEYRSHLYLRALSKQDPLGQEPNQLSSELSVKITPIFGFTIPAIVQVGNPVVTASITHAKVIWKDNQPMLDMNIERTGTKSVYGNIRVDYRTTDGNFIELELIKGLAVYTPTTRRHILMALNKSVGVDYHRGQLRISYEEDGTKRILFDKAELELR